MLTRPPHALNLLLAASLGVLATSGCTSPYYADRGAAAGGLLGAGAGALIGSQTGNTGAGAALGAGLGALTGSVFGAQMDEVAAQNRAAIATQLGRQVTPGVATVDEVIAMSRAGVDQQLISNYVTTSGMSAPITAQDVIYLHQQGVADPVIVAMQTPPPPPAPPVVVQEVHHHGPPVYYEPYPCAPRVGFGVTIRN